MSLVILLIRSLKVEPQTSNQHIDPDVPGSTIQVVSGTFSRVCSLSKLNYKTKMVN